MSPEQREIPRFLEVSLIFEDSLIPPGLVGDQCKSYHTGDFQSGNGWTLPVLPDWRNNWVTDSVCANMGQ